MAEENRGIVTAGARALWRRHRIIWALYGANLLLGLVAVFPAFVAMSRVLDSSLAAARLYRSFDLGAFGDLMMNREAALTGHIAGSVALALLFMPIVLFLSPGILEAYRCEGGARVPASEFFQACATFFWRFVRLFLIFAIAFAALRWISVRAQGLASSYADRSLHDVLALRIEIGVIVLGFILPVLLRMWFDLAQAQAVVTGERAVRRSARAAFRLLFARFGALVWIYLRTFVAAAIVLGLVAAAWFELPASAVGVTFLLTQLFVLVTLTTRLWQRACAVLFVARLTPAAVTPAAEQLLLPVVLTNEPETAAAAVDDSQLPLPGIFAEEPLPTEPPAPEPPSASGEPESKRIS